MIKEYMTDKKLTFCSKGSLKVIVRTKGHGVQKGNEQLLNANDHVVGENIQCYGVCSCGSVCQPITPKVWIRTNDKNLLEGSPQLISESCLFCMRGGVISFCDGGEYGLDEFIRDVLAGNYSATITQDDFEKIFNTIFGDKKLAGVIDFSSAVGMAMATQLLAANIATAKDPIAKGMLAGSALLMTMHTTFTGLNGMGELLEGAGFGEYDWDIEKAIAKSASPQYGELVYNTYNLKNSVKDAWKSRKILDYMGVGKDLKDVNDAAVEIENPKTVMDSPHIVIDKNINVMSEIYNY